jgi:two-component system sensor histidine kinase BaeS
MFKIRHKLFLMLITATGGVVLCMYLVMQWSFESGFLHYINQQQEQRLLKLAKTVSAYWDKDTQWQTIEEHPRIWHEEVLQILRQDKALSSPPIPDMPPDMGDPEAAPLPEYLGRRDGLFRHRRPPQRGAPPLQRPDQERRPPVLLDANKRRVAGPPDGQQSDPQFPPLRLIPILHNGQTIGYISFHPRQRISNELNIAFAQQQKQSFLIIAGIVILIGIVLSIPAARWLVKPVQRVISGTRKLISGKFDTRIPVTSQDELGELATHFNRLAQTLEENESARRRWVADISHELRTPLAILKGEIEAIQDGVRPLSFDAIQSLQCEVAHLNHRVNDLYELSMSDIGALNYKMQPIEIARLVEEDVGNFRERCEQAGLSIALQTKLEHPAYVLGDEARLKQLFHNLLTNTLRYTDLPGELRIKVIKQGKQIEIHWEDSAPDVASSELPRLFDRLYRVEASRNRAKGGAGLGLSICQNIVKAHQGTIDVTHSSLGGLCLQIHLPIYSK